MNAPPSLPPLIGIVAMTDQRVIGTADGQLPWHLPEDLAFFKKTTRGHPILMGRKTHQSIGRPLPQRQNLVLTRDPHLQLPGVQTLQRLSDLPPLLEQPAPVYVIGGAEIYQLLLPHLTELLVTHVHHPYPGSVHFPSSEHLFAPGDILAQTPQFTIRRHHRLPTPSRQTRT